MIQVPIGRADAQAADPEGRLPAETLSAEELKACFAAKGLSAQQLVALSGAHTIGSKVRCAACWRELCLLRRQLRAGSRSCCLSAAAPSPHHPHPLTSHFRNPNPTPPPPPTHASSQGFGDAETFDNAYYAALLRKPWLDPKQEMASMIGLPSDHVLPEDPQLLPAIQRYAADQGAFFEDFAAAYLALTSLGVRQ